MKEYIDFGFVEEDFEDDPVLYEAGGCNRCSYGYKGRFAILETLPMTRELQRIIIKGEPNWTLRIRESKREC